MSCLLTTLFIEQPTLNKNTESHQNQYENVACSPNMFQTRCWPYFSRTKVVILVLVLRVSNKAGMAGSLQYTVLATFKLVLTLQTPGCVTPNWRTFRQKSQRQPAPVSPY